MLKSGPKHIQCTEDEDFMAAFDKMLEDNAKVNIAVVLISQLHV